VKRRSTTLALVLLVLSLTPAAAYVLWARWPTASHHIYYGKLGDFRSAFVSSANQWTQQTVFTLSPRSNQIGSCDDFNGPLLNGAEFYPQDCSGADLWPYTIAITQCYINAGQFQACGITFSSEEHWAVYDGTFDPWNPDFRRVALHELGHIVGLGHTSNPSAIMYASAGVTSLHADDIAGVAALYPEATGSLSVSPSSGFSASGPQGGPFSPSSKTYVLNNPGGGAIDFAVTEALSWLSVNPTSGSLGPGASTDVTVSISSSAASLSPDTYTGSVSFTNTTNGSGNTSRAASLSVTSPPSPPAITAPTPGSVLGGSSVTFTWAQNDSTVSGWWLMVGSSAGGSDLFSSGWLGAATTSLTVSGLPTDGRTVYVRLFYYEEGGWRRQDFQYTAAGP
jgi:hypothetical protein